VEVFPHVVFNASFYPVRFVYYCIVDVGPLWCHAANEAGGALEEATIVDWGTSLSMTWANPVPHPRCTTGARM